MPIHISFCHWWKNLSTAPLKEIFSLGKSKEKRMFHQRILRYFYLQPDLIVSFNAQTQSGQETISSYDRIFLYFHTLILTFI